MTNANMIKTGTTCIGLVFDGGVLLAADRRATGGLVTEGVLKVHNISSHIGLTFAGHASDCQLVGRILAGELKLIELKAERKPYVSEAAMIANSIQYSAIRTQGSIASLIIGGYDVKNGLTLYNLSPDGTILPHEGYIVDGSGSIFIKGLFDTEYTPKIKEKEALALVEKAFRVSFKNDTASGGGFIAKIITKDGIKDVSRKVVKTEMVNEQ